MPVANFNLGIEHIEMIETHAATLNPDKPNVSAALRNILDDWKETKRMLSEWRSEMAQADATGDR